MDKFYKQIAIVENIALSLKEEASKLWKIMEEQMLAGKYKEYTSTEVLKLLLKVGKIISPVSYDFKDVFELIGMTSVRFHGMDAVKNLMKSEGEETEIRKQFPADHAPTIDGDCNCSACKEITTKALELVNQIVSSNKKSDIN